MATLQPTLTLTSQDATSEALSFTVTDSLTITTPLIGLSKAVATATPGDTTIVPAGTVVVLIPGVTGF